MFSGIIESLGEVKDIIEEGTNLHFEIYSPFSDELYIDQSIAHNGVCMTVIKLEEGTYTVTAIEETLNLTNLNELKIGDKVNLERCVKANMRMDGHIVQGHVDAMAKVSNIEERDGSWYFHFNYDPKHSKLLVSKGSVTVNGVSLTLVNPQSGSFAVAIIPYTYEHTNFHTLKIGDRVNLEFDIIGKYVARYLDQIQVPSSK